MVAGTLCGFMPKKPLATPTIMDVLELRELQNNAQVADAGRMDGIVMSELARIQAAIVSQTIYTRNIRFQVEFKYPIIDQHVRDRVIQSLISKGYSAEFRSCFLPGASSIGSLVISW